jgi:hypothetical protein
MFCDFGRRRRRGDEGERDGGGRRETEGAGAKDFRGWQEGRMETREGIVKIRADVKQIGFNYNFAARKTVELIREILGNHGQHKILVNANFPNVAKEEEIKGFKHTKQGKIFNAGEKKTELEFSGLFWPKPYLTGEKLLSPAGGRGRGRSEEDEEGEEKYEGVRRM